MSGKSVPEITVTTEEVSEAFKRSGLPLSRFAGFDAGFDAGYRLGKAVRAEGEYLAEEQCPPTEVVFAGGRA